MILNDGMFLSLHRTEQKAEVSSIFGIIRI